ncbi:hypothetical protein DFQ01_12918 [Paenibacillus cellulosilyticus]|uniref:Uncharacterized protein n=1 Tax=Paenibacillus cellulosilyticus TaxID=375489 RepID=A0A2V2YM59_9BACL|nr:hypothetical protein [Paenibacillus cellulosilyticus]PWV95183.1 hypothetical protein DFQ01_12918 [Paenibacillus cellulosilyticus]QKS46063.1 hypothetical protein HUB94_17695 [Paenibacillus cellulosilyticus]
MKKKMIGSFLLVFTVMCFMCLNSILFAAPASQSPDPQNQIADNSIKQSILTDYQQHYASSLDSAKSDFNGSSGSFQNATLGNGIAYYQIADDHTDPFIFAGYIFPIELDGKELGTVYANNDSGEWKIFRVNNVKDYTQSVNKAKSNVNTGDKTKVIDDMRYGISALYINGGDGEHIVDLHKGSDFKKKPYSDFKNSIDKVRLDNQNMKSKTKDGAIQFGSGSVNVNNNDKSNHTYIYLLIAAVAFLFPVFYLLRNKRTVKP